jgi:tRNA uridine 5-carbamoylmethylation protein Kti12
LNNNTNFLIILVGLPASGKTTFAFKLKEKLEGYFQKTVKIIDPDKIRAEFFPNNFDYRNEPLIREKNIQSVRSQLLKGHIVISDDLNYYSSMRHDLKLIADSLTLNFYIIHISTPLKLCLKRNEERGKPIPNEIIHNISSRFDNFDKYKWDTPFETYNFARDRDLPQFLETLNKKIIFNLEEFKKRKNKFQNIPSISIRDKLELITRKHVGELLKNPNNHSSKIAILEHRKLFIKSRTDEELDASKILEDFKRYLRKNLKV